MQNAAASLPAWFDRVLEFLATGAGLGRLPGAPGTYGSAWGLLLAWAAAPLSDGVRLAAASGCFLAGIPLCHRVATRWSQTDPAAIVWDEIAAVPFLFLLAPFTARNAVVGFILFRLFDTVKPWPVRRFEKLHGGLGIMADDLAAAIGSAMVLWAVHLNWP